MSGLYGQPAYGQPMYGQPSYAQPVATSYAPLQTSYAQPQAFSRPQPLMQAQPVMMQQPIVQQQPLMVQQPQQVMRQQPVYQTEHIRQPVQQPMYQPSQPVYQQAQPAYHQPQQQVPGGGQFVADDAAAVPLTGNVHILITGIDYACDRQSWAGPPPNGHGPLDTRFAFDYISDLAHQSGAASITQLWNQQCTKENICGTIMQVGRRCQPGDTFVFYYTGHGDQLPNTDPNDPEQSDQCLCTVDAAGNTDDASMQYRAQVWLRDDDLAAAIQNGVCPGAKSLILVDACHSGTICDFQTNPRWAQRGLNAISISGCQDKQTSAGTGKGGVYTRALTLAIEEVQASHGHTSFNVASVYNATLQKYKETNPPGHDQLISIHGCGLYPQQFPWPLQPRGQYTSPADTQGQHQHFHQPVGNWASPVAQPVHYAQPPMQNYSAPTTYAQPARVYQQPMMTSMPAQMTYAAPAPPLTTYAAPAPQMTYAAPPQTYAAPRMHAAPTTYAAPLVHMHAPAPPPMYAAPPMTYSAPVTSYQPPIQQSYAAPQMTYAAPAPPPMHYAPPPMQYSAPVTSYQPPVQIHAQQYTSSPVTSYQPPIQVQHQPAVMTGRAYGPGPLPTTYASPMTMARSALAPSYGAPMGSYGALAGGFGLR